MRNRRYEQGGVVSFVIVATVLALLLVGAILWAKQQGKVNTPVVKQPVTQVAQSSPTTTTSNSEQQTNTSTSQETTPASSSTSATSSTTNQQSTPSSAASTATNTQVTSNKVASTGPSVDQLPSTGPAELFMTTVALSAVSATVYVLARSRRQLRSSALSK